jgi:pimeloyl-ACP methyl ester carboxylesterase
MLDIGLKIEKGLDMDLTMLNQSSEPPSDSSVAAKPPVGRYYDVDGRQLLLHRSGTGGPAVVFLPGGGAVGLDYLNVQRGVAELTTSVVYDRAGTGWSDSVGLPRTLAEVTDELRGLLRVAEVPPPYVMVGHSLGGLYARHYAQRFPDEVSGMVLLDPAHEEYNAHMPKELVDQWAAWDPGEALPEELPAELIKFYRALFEQEMTDWPEEIRQVLVERHVSLDSLRASLQEATNVEELYDEVRNAGPIADVPVIILTSMDIDPFKAAVSQGISESLLREEIDGKRRLYTTWARSTHGENRLIEDVGHVTLHFRRPDAVLQAIRDLLDKPDK